MATGQDLSTPVRASSASPIVPRLSAVLQETGRLCKYLLRGKAGVTKSGTNFQQLNVPSSLSQQLQSIQFGSSRGRSLGHVLGFNLGKSRQETQFSSISSM